MSFLRALALVRELEGGKWMDPTGGPTNAGITQRTWAAFGFPGSVMDASEGQIAAFYRKYWDSLKIYDDQTDQDRPVFELLPEPVDALAFQFFINIPPLPIIPSLQAACLTAPDGKFGYNSLVALRTSSRDELLRGILTAQLLHYVCHSKQSLLPGLFARVERARVWALKELD